MNLLIFGRRSIGISDLRGPVAEVTLVRNDTIRFRACEHGKSAVVEKKELPSVQKGQLLTV